LRPHTYICIFIVVEKAQVKRFPKLAAIMISPDTIRTAIGVIGE
jgi:galactitol-specific phosphotransferase system IIC component